MTDDVEWKLELNLRQYQECRWG